MSQENKLNSTTDAPDSRVAYLLAYQERNNLTDAQFCTLLGVTKSALYSWKTCARLPSQTAYRMVQVLSVVETLAPGIHDALIK